MYFYIYPYHAYYNDVSFSILSPNNPDIRGGKEQAKYYHEIEKREDLCGEKENCHEIKFSSYFLIKCNAKIAAFFYLLT